MSLLNPESTWNKSRQISGGENPSKGFTKLSISWCPRRHRVIPAGALEKIVRVIESSSSAIYVNKEQNWKEVEAQPLVEESETLDFAVHEVG